VPGGADVWRTPELERLVRALNVWRVGTGDFLAMAADPEWPAFPGAQIVAALVTAAERSAPGCRAALVSWSPGAPPSARRSLRIRVEVLHRGVAGDVTARLVVDQRNAPRGPRRPHGQAVVLLTPDGGERPGGGRATREVTPLPAGEIAASGIVPPELVADGFRAGLDATTTRALLAYVGAAVTLPPGLGSTVLASTIAFVGPVGEALTLGRLGAGAPADGHAHAMTEFRTPLGLPVVQISQAVLVH
jgi:hypothetical protein